MWLSSSACAIDSLANHRGAFYGRFTLPLGIIIKSASYLQFPWLTQDSVSGRSHQHLHKLWNLWRNFCAYCASGPLKHIANLKFRVVGANCFIKWEYMKWSPTRCKKLEITKNNQLLLSVLGNTDLWFTSLSRHCSFPPWWVATISEQIMAP